MHCGATPAWLGGGRGEDTPKYMGLLQTLLQQAFFKKVCCFIYVSNTNLTKLNIPKKSFWSSITCYFSMPWFEKFPEKSDESLNWKSKRKFACLNNVEMKILLKKKVEKV